MKQEKRATTLLVILFLFSIINGCNKDDDNDDNMPANCNVKGTYSGNNRASTGASSAISYTLKDNNFAVGSLTPNGTGVTFGGYRNTCDSVIMSVYYSANNSYYLLEGKLSNNGNTISGNFKNLTTTSDFGTFTITK